MFNILLDRLPDDYNGYLIRTDFRIGIQITAALNDRDLHEDEQLQTALDLLYGSGKPDFETAVEGLKWFLSGGEETDGDGVECFNFEQDNQRIYTAFRVRYGIDLSRSSLHWFEFTAMLGDLGDCALTDVINIRTIDISKMSSEQQKIYLKLKSKYAIKHPLTEEEKALLDEFEANFS